MTEKPYFEEKFENKENIDDNLKLSDNAKTLTEKQQNLLKTIEPLLEKINISSDRLKLLNNSINEHINTKSNVWELLKNINSLWFNIQMSEIILANSNNQKNNNISDRNAILTKIAPQFKNITKYLGLVVS